MEKLLAFRGFADVPQGALAAIEGFALVGIELCLNLGFGVQNAGLKLRIAALADTYRGKWRFFHDPQFALHDSSLAIWIGRT
jgi:hypothetical protein